MSEGEDSNVIHVAFGRQQRGRRVEPVARPPEPAAAPRSSHVARESDPVASVYSRVEAARIVAVDPAKLRGWERAGLARPSAEQQGVRRYTFQDLVALRTAKELVEQGVPVARIRRALDALRRSLPGAAPLADLRIVSDGTSVAVRTRGGTYDPLTGQLLLDFPVSALRDDVVRALPARGAPRGDARSAYDWYLEGCRLDGDEASHARAETAYRRAIALDPALASAYTNLGTLRLIAGDKREAEALFRRAMDSDDAQAEAPYNLGFLALEAGDPERAITLLERALQLDEQFADAHFNVAVAYEETGRSPRALAHWLAYLALEPDGPWAPIARQRVKQLE